MTRQALVGLFTLIGLAALFAVFYVLGNFGGRSGYKVGIHFNSAAGLHQSALVYLSGVPIGAVDGVELHPDYTVSVIVAVKPQYEIPRDSRFLIEAPLTGEPSVLIVPPRGRQQVATLPHEVLPVERQPYGSDPASVADLLAQGQGELRRFDAMLAQLQKVEPKLLAGLDTAIANTNRLTVTANDSLTTLTYKVTGLTDSLQRTVDLAGANVVELTSTLKETGRADSEKIDGLLSSLQRTSQSFGEAVDSLREVATDPRMKKSLRDTVQGLASTSRTLADLTNDLRQVTGNQQTQAQLRDTVAQLDATSQKIDSLVASLGGTSSVYGVDKGATPAPAPSGGVPALPGSRPLPGVSPLPGSSSPPGASLASPAPGTFAGGTKPGAAAPPPAIAGLRQKLGSFTKDLVQLQVRVSELAPQRPGSAQGNVSPLLHADRGPQADFNVAFLQRFPTSFVGGVNDLGGTTTANVLLVKHQGPLALSGGILYSQLGMSASVTERLLGIEGRLYDLRHPTLDTYLNLNVLPKVQLFGGGRDMTHVDRRAVFGLQFEF